VGEANIPSYLSKLEVNHSRGIDNPVALDEGCQFFIDVIRATIGAAQKAGKGTVTTAPVENSLN
jgi:hypothetical protein